MALHLRGSQKATEAEKALPGGGLQTTFQVEGFVQAESRSDGNLAKKKTRKKVAQKTTQPKEHSQKEKSSNAASDHLTPPIPTSKDSVQDNQEILPQTRGHCAARHTIENPVEEQDRSL
ncbi:hypothetical protein ARMGADRAFT_556174 [Armillaria gallica]|uniref:Uncharacterized protein n=1 Tax=Armillaria gallica TaxID=47427 RepID=A0A2H3CQZ6_ARMGA|nr:hypothetical protein ARMGADRAFT_556174 [Armillaria gallica]